MTKMPPAPDTADLIARLEAYAKTWVAVEHAFEPHLLLEAAAALSDLSVRLATVERNARRLRNTALRLAMDGALSGTELDNAIDAALAEEQR